jgi:hypothetical protein
MPSVQHSPYQAAQSAAVVAAAAAQMAQAHRPKMDRAQTLQGELDVAAVNMHMPSSVFGPAYFDPSGAACLPAMQEEYAAAHERAAEAAGGDEVSNTTSSSPLSGGPQSLYLCTPQKFTKIVFLKHNSISVVH